MTNSDKNYNEIMTVVSIPGVVNTSPQQNVATSNKLITKRDVENILNAVKPIGDNGSRLQIRNLEHYQTAFVHKSYLHEADTNLNYNPTQSNEVLEFLGDSFVGATVAKYLVDRFEGQQEGFLTKTRTILVRSNMLNRFARFLMLGSFILLSPQVERLTSIGANKGRNNPRLFEDAFEAFVGAMIQDFHDPEDPVGGCKYVYRFVIGIIEHLIDFSEIILNNENFKDTLQRYFQSRKFENPVHVDLLESGPSHLKSFTKGVFLKREYLEQLSPDVIQQTLEYHEDQLKMNIPKVVEAIKKHCEESNSVVIGVAAANKKAVAEQTCSSIALCCLKIDHNWINTKKDEAK